MFVRQRLLEARKLAVEQRGRHEMRVACREPPGDQVPIALEIDEADIGAATDQDIAIGTLERRASDGAMIPDAPRRIDPGGDAVQPGPAILVGERHAAVHLLYVRRGVEPVALLEDPIQPMCEHHCDRALAATGDPHQHKDRRIRQRRGGFRLQFPGLLLWRKPRDGKGRRRGTAYLHVLQAPDHERATCR